MFILNFKSLFLRKEKKLTKGNIHLQKRIIITLKKLEHDPFDISLGSHKVNRKNGEIAFSSRVTGNIRIIWQYNNGIAEVLDILDVGGHSGNNSVY